MKKIILLIIIISSIIKPLEETIRHQNKDISDLTLQELRERHEDTLHEYTKLNKSLINSGIYNNYHFQTPDEQKLENLSSNLEDLDDHSLTLQEFTNSPKGISLPTKNNVATLQSLSEQELRKQYENEKQQHDSLKNAAQQAIKSDQSYWGWSNDTQNAVRAYSQHNSNVSAIKIAAKTNGINLSSPSNIKVLSQDSNIPEQKTPKTTKKPIYINDILTPSNHTEIDTNQNDQILEQLTEKQLQDEQRKKRILQLKQEGQETPEQRAARHRKEVIALRLEEEDKQQAQQELISTQKKAEYEQQQTDKLKNEQQAKLKDAEENSFTNYNPQNIQDMESVLGDQNTAYYEFGRSVVPELADPTELVTELNDQDLYQRVKAQKKQNSRINPDEIENDLPTKQQTINLDDLDIEQTVKQKTAQRQQAATKIQSIQRQRTAKQELQKLKTNKTQADIKNKAATDIQRITRGQQTRNKITVAKNQAQARQQFVTDATKSMTGIMNEQQHEFDNLIKHAKTSLSNAQQQQFQREAQTLFDKEQKQRDINTDKQQNEFKTLMQQITDSQSAAIKTTKKREIKEKQNQLHKTQLSVNTTQKLLQHNYDNLSMDDLIYQKNTRDTHHQNLTNLLQHQIELDQTQNNKNSKKQLSIQNDIDNNDKQQAILNQKINQKQQNLLKQNAIQSRTQNNQQLLADFDNEFSPHIQQLQQKIIDTKHATKIQSLQRQRKAKQELEKLKNDKAQTDFKNKAATKIQSRQRQRKAEQEFKTLKQLISEHNKNQEQARQEFATNATKSMTDIMNEQQHELNNLIKNKKTSLSNTQQQQFQREAQALFDQEQKQRDVNTNQLQQEFKTLIQKIENSTSSAQKIAKKREAKELQEKVKNDKIAQEHAYNVAAHTAKNQRKTELQNIKSSAPQGFDPIQQAANETKARQDKKTQEEFDKLNINPGVIEQPQDYKNNLSNIIQDNEHNAWQTWEDTVIEPEENTNSTVKQPKSKQISKRKSPFAKKDIKNSTWQTAISKSKPFVKTSSPTTPQELTVQETKSQKSIATDTSQSQQQSLSNWQKVKRLFFTSTKIVQDAMKDQNNSLSEEEKNKLLKALKSGLNKNAKRRQMRINSILEEIQQYPNSKKAQDIIKLLKNPQFNLLPEKTIILDTVSHRYKIIPTAQSSLKAILTSKKIPSKKWVQAFKDALSEKETTLQSIEKLAQQITDPDTQQSQVIITAINESLTNKNIQSNPQLRIITFANKKPEIKLLTKQDFNKYIKSQPNAKM